MEKNSVFSGLLSGAKALKEQIGMLKYARMADQMTSMLKNVDTNINDLTKFVERYRNQLSEIGLTKEEAITLLAAMHQSNLTSLDELIAGVQAGVEFSAATLGQKELGVVVNEALSTVTEFTDLLKP